MICKLLWAVLPSIFVGISLWLFQRKANKRAKTIDDRAEFRKKESLLLLNMQFAIGKLTYALAMAKKRGYPNGEIEEGIEAYEAAKADYNRFLNETHQEIIHDK